MPYNRKIDPEVKNYSEFLYAQHLEKVKHYDVKRRWAEIKMLTGRDSKPMTEYWDVPSVCEVCHGGGKSARDYSRGIRENHIPAILKSELKKIGPIGSIRKDRKCLYPIGHCAEQHSAMALYRKNVSISPNKIEFGKAVRPRTGQVIAFCQNCKDVFNL